MSFQDLGSQCNQDHHVLLIQIKEATFSTQVGSPWKLGERPNISKWDWNPNGSDARLRSEAFSIGLSKGLVLGVAGHNPWSPQNQPRKGPDSGFLSLISLLERAIKNDGLLELMELDILIKAPSSSVGGNRILKYGHLWGTISWVT